MPSWEEWQFFKSLAFEGVRWCMKSVEQDWIQGAVSVYDLASFPWFTVTEFLFKFFEERLKQMAWNLISVLSVCSRSIMFFKIKHDMCASAVNGSSVDLLLTLGREWKGLYRLLFVKMFFVGSLPFLSFCIIEGMEGVL